MEASQPESGYHITNVYVDSVDQGAISTYTFYNVTATHTISVVSAVDTGDLTVTGKLTVEGIIQNNGIYYKTLDTDGSTPIEVTGVENIYPNTDFHFIPDFTTKTDQNEVKGISRVFFGYGSDWGSYNWMSGVDEFDNAI